MIPKISVSHALACFSLLATSAWAGAAAETKSLDQGLVAHWKLQDDFRDSSGHGNDGTGQNVAFGAGPASSGAALFNGRDAMVTVKDAPSLHFGQGDFSVSVWVRPEGAMSSIFGDILSKFDGAKRQGINFHIAGSSPGYMSMSDTRHVHFGIDDGSVGSWTDCGRPSPTNSLITNLVVFDGQLYAGIGDAAKPEDACHVFRWESGSKWVDCGRLGDNPNHLSVQSLFVHDGKLYAGTGIWSVRRAWGGEVKAGRAAAAKPRVFVYEGGQKWRDLGQVNTATRIMCMASFKGELYVGTDRGDAAQTVPGRIYKLAGEKWVDCGAPGKAVNVENLLPFGGELYCTTHGGIYRYAGGDKWTSIGENPFGVTQIHSLDAYHGQIYIGTWPQGYVLRYEGGDKWSKVGLLGLPEGKPECNEINDLTVYNGKMYAGVIPMAEVYRYEDNGRWTRLTSLGHQPTLSRSDADSWCRVTAMTSYQGRLFAGTGSCRGLTENQDPEGTLGRVHSMQIGQVVSHERDIGSGWTHLAAVRHGAELQLYVNGALSATSTAVEGRVFDVTNTEQLLIGFGAQTYFTGGISDLRIYARALSGSDVTQLHTAHSSP